MTLETVRRKERLVGVAILAALLIPAVFFARRVNADRRYVVFLRWIDDQAGIERGSWTDPYRTESEVALYREVARKTTALTPDFENLGIPDKWATIRHREVTPTFTSFERLLAEGEVRIQGVEIDFTTSEVSANVGALLLGFRHAVADLLWLQVNASWENGLVNRMLPLMNTVVSLDPQFIEAYSLGAWHLAYNIGSVRVTQTQKSQAVHDAIDFVEGGLRKNPRSSQLYEDMGFTLYFRKLNDYEQAEVYLVQGTKFEPHEPRMERAAAIMIERQRREGEALEVLQAYHEKHPTWFQHTLAMDRLEKKLHARELERSGDLEAAYAAWEAIYDEQGRALAEPVAPLEMVRLEGLIEARDREALTDWEGARAALMRTRTSLPELYHDDISERIRSLTQRLGDTSG